MTLLLDLANPQRRALDLVKEVATEKECRPFLVGGPVRDLLLGRHVIDIDLTLEDGSSTLARALAKRVEGRVRSFPQFLTYKITAEGLPEIDIATARKERYRKPGALPTVTPGRLKDDLLRRDFSINAMAMDLDSGSLHDPTNGEHDIRARIVRILHDQSFADDPTRVFRAIRLASRLDFDIEPHTLALLQQALAEGALANISRERIWRELFLAMDEADAPKVLAALHGYGALDALFGDLPEEKLTARLELVKRQLEVEPELDRHVLYAAALLHGHDVSTEQFDGSGFSQKRMKIAMQIAHEVPRFLDALSNAQSDRHRFRLYKSVSPEMLSVIAGDRPSEAEHIGRYQEFRKFKLALRGNDLEVPGGPHVARALERTREAVFNGEIPADEARTFARQLAMQYLQSNAAEQSAETRNES